MKLRNLMKTPLSFNFSDGTPIHLASRELSTSLDEKYRDDPQVTRRVKRGYLRIYDESPKSSPKDEPKSSPKDEVKLSPSKSRKKTAVRGESQGTTARRRDGEEEKSD